jgi:hypothetical protein
MTNRSLVGVLLLFLTLATTNARDLPYKGSASGAVVDSYYLSPPVMGGDPFLHEEARAIGNFTYLGRSTVSLVWDVSLDWSGVVVEGTFTIVGAKGDSMFGSFSSLQPFLSATSVSPWSTIVVTVTGGTGRFEGAAGTIPGNGERAGDLFSYVLNGTIVLP